MKIADILKARKEANPPIQFLKWFDNHIKSIEKIDQWISPSDQLPETTVRSKGTENEYYQSSLILVTLDGEEVFLGRYENGNGFEQFVEKSDEIWSCPFSEVIGWKYVEL